MTDSPVKEPASPTATLPKVPSSDNQSGGQSRGSQYERARTKELQLGRKPLNTQTNLTSPYSNQSPQYVQTGSIVTNVNGAGATSLRTTNSSQGNAGTPTGGSSGPQTTGQRLEDVQQQIGVDSEAYRRQQAESAARQEHQSRFFSTRGNPEGASNGGASHERVRQPELHDEMKPAPHRGEERRVVDAPDAGLVRHTAGDGRTIDRETNTFVVSDRSVGVISAPAEGQRTSGESTLFPSAPHSRWGGEKNDLFSGSRGDQGQQGHAQEWGHTWEDRRGLVPAAPPGAPNIPRGGFPAEDWRAPEPSREPVNKRDDLKRDHVRSEDYGTPQRDGVELKHEGGKFSGEAQQDRQPNPGKVLIEGGTVVDTPQGTIPLRPPVTAVLKGEPSAHLPTAPVELTVSGAGKDRVAPQGSGQSSIPAIPKIDLEQPVVVAKPGGPISPPSAPVQPTAPSAARAAQPVKDVSEGTPSSNVPPVSSQPSSVISAPTGTTVTIPPAGSTRVTIPSSPETTIPAQKIVISPIPQGTTHVAPVQPVVTSTITTGTPTIHVTGQPSAPVEATRSIGSIQDRTNASEVRARGIETTIQPTSGQTSTYTREAPSVYSGSAGNTGSGDSGSKPIKLPEAPPVRPVVQDAHHVIPRAQIPPAQIRVDPRVVVEAPQHARIEGQSAISIERPEALAKRIVKEGIPEAQPVGRALVQEPRGPSTAGQTPRAITGSNEGLQNQSRLPAKESETQQRDPKASNGPAAIVDQRLSLPKMLLQVRDMASSIAAVQAISMRIKDLGEQITKIFQGIVGTQSKKVEKHQLRAVDAVVLRELKPEQFTRQEAMRVIVGIVNEVHPKIKAIIEEVNVETQLKLSRIQNLIDSVVRLRTEQLLILCRNKDKLGQGTFQRIMAETIQELANSDQLTPEQKALVLGRVVVSVTCADFDRSEVIRSAEEAARKLSEQKARIFTKEEVEKLRLESAIFFEKQLSEVAKQRDEELLAQAEAELLRIQQEDVKSKYAIEVLDTTNLREYRVVRVNQIKVKVFEIVRGVQTNKPLKGVQICGGILGILETDENGEVIFDNIPEGSPFILGPDKKGYTFNNAYASGSLDMHEQFEFYGERLEDGKARVSGKKRSGNRKRA